MSHVLTLMFSNTGSIKAYKTVGSYPRFLDRLHAYAQHFEAVHVCTNDDHDYTAELGILNVFHHPMPRFASTSALYHLFSPLIHGRALRHTTVIRTFNITGALPALLLRALTGASVFVSYGYSLPRFVRVERGPLKALPYRLIERIALRGSNHIICATPTQMRCLGERYGRHKVLLLPNFVDTERFRPISEAGGDYLLFVGRLSTQKNVDGLLHGLRLALDQGIKLPPIRIIGQGDQEGILRRIADKLQLPAQFCGVAPNNELPQLYSRAWAYVLPSRFEGMPKTLLEAMSCGVPCLVSDVEGPRELIRDGINGVLVEPTPKGVAAGLRRLAEDESFRRRIGAEARRHVVSNFSKSEILFREIQILKETGR